MTIEEAYKHAEEVASKKRDEYQERVAVNDMESAEECGRCGEQHEQLAEWLKELKKLREQQQWIPCSERLPEEHAWIGTKRFGTTISDEVYVTFEALNGKRFCEHCRFQNGEISLSKRIEVDTISKGAKPVAWCELPQPWKGDKK